jgi:dihydroneopterin aldolase
MDDNIFISALELHAHIGVPTAERTAPQPLTLSIRLFPMRCFVNLHDDIANTIDYATVCDAVRTEAAAKPRRLIETLAEDIAALLLSCFPVKAVEIELRKYVLPDSDFAAVCIRRER